MTTTKTKSERRKAIFSVLLAAILWGTTGTSRALGSPGAGAASVGSMRIIVGGFFLFIIAIRKAKITNWVNWTKESKIAIAAGTAGIVLYQISFFGAVSHAGVAIGTLVAIGSAPIASGLIGLIMKEIPSKRWFIATFLALIGLFFLTSFSPNNPVSTYGIILALAAGVCYSTFTVSARFLATQGNHGITTSATFFVLGSIIYAFSLPFDHLGWVFHPSGIMVSLWLGLATVVAPYILFSTGLNHIKASTATTIGLAEPLTATILGVTLLGEHFTLTSLLGASLILIGIVITASNN